MPCPEQHSQTMQCQNCGYLQNEQKQLSLKNLVCRFILAMATIAAIPFILTLSWHMVEIIRWVPIAKVITGIAKAITGTGLGLIVSGILEWDKDRKMAIRKLIAGIIIFGIGIAGFVGTITLVTGGQYPPISFYDISILLVNGGCCLLILSSRSRSFVKRAFAFRINFIKSMSMQLRLSV